MSTNPVDIALNSDEWKPSERCRGWLLWGMLGALVQGLLYTGALIIDLGWPDHENAVSLLTLLTVLPHVVMLPAFLKLAREAGSRALWKSAFSVYAAMWIIILLAPIPLEIVGNQVAGLLVVIGGIGIAALVIFTFSKWPRFGSPPEKSATPKSADAGGGGCANHLWWLVGLGILRRVMRGRLIPKMGPNGFVGGELILAAILMTCHFMWFATSKIRLRERLGAPAMLLGTIELLIAAVTLGMIGIAAATLFQAAGAGMDEAELETLLDRWNRPSTLVIGISCISWCLATAIFFWSVRRRGEPDWRDQLMNIGPDPRHIQR